MRLRPIYSETALSVAAAFNDRDKKIANENIEAILANPQRAGRPAFSSKAQQGAWQHTCPRRLLVLYRWASGGNAHPPDAVTIDHILPYYA
jgi:predicted component of type VI protein secretion system